MKSITTKIHMALTKQSTGAVVPYQKFAISNVSIEIVYVQCTKCVVFLKICAVDRKVLNGNQDICRRNAEFRKMHR